MCRKENDTCEHTFWRCKQVKKLWGSLNLSSLCGVQKYFFSRVVLQGGRSVDGGDKLSVLGVGVYGTNEMGVRCDKWWKVTLLPNISWKGWGI